MKRLIIALLVLAAITIAGCSSLPLQNDNAPSNGLTKQEQQAVTFIAANAPQLDAIYDQIGSALDSGSTGDWASVKTKRSAYVDKFNALNANWKAFPAAGGKVAALEQQFEATANDLVDLDNNIVDICNGDTTDASTGQAAIAKFNADRAVLQTELDQFTGTSPSTTT